MKHRRIWLDDSHPAECRADETWCLSCNCCQHCYHECWCPDCSCPLFSPEPPVLHEAEDEDQPSLYGGAA